MPFRLSGHSQAVAERPGCSHATESRATRGDLVRKGGGLLLLIEIFGITAQEPPQLRAWDYNCSLTAVQMARGALAIRMADWLLARYRPPGTADAMHPNRCSGCGESDAYYGQLLCPQLHADQEGTRNGPPLSSLDMVPMRCRAGR